MGKIKVDFSQAKEFEVLPIGNYPVVVEEIEVRESNSSEFPYLNWKMRVETGEHARRVIWMMTSLSPKAAFRLKAVLRALGEEIDDKAEDIDIDPDDYVGRRAVAVLEHEMYNDSPRERCNELIPAGGGSGGGSPKLR